MPGVEIDTYLPDYSATKRNHTGLYPESENRFLGVHETDPRFLEEQTYDEAFGPNNPRRRRSVHEVDEWRESPEIEAVLIRVGAGQQAVHNVRDNLALHPERYKLKRGRPKK